MTTRILVREEGFEVESQVYGFHTWIDGRDSKLNSVLTMMSLSSQGEIKLELLRTQFNIQVSSSGEKKKCQVRERFGSHQHISVLFNASTLNEVTSKKGDHIIYGPNPESFES